MSIYNKFLKQKFNINILRNHRTYFIQKDLLAQVEAMHTFDPSTLGAEAGRSLWDWGQPGLQSYAKTGSKTTEKHWHKNYSLKLLNKRIEISKL